MQSQREKEQGVDESRETKEALLGNEKHTLACWRYLLGQGGKRMEQRV